MENYISAWFVLFRWFYNASFKECGIFLIFFIFSKIFTTSGQMGGMPMFSWMLYDTGQGWAKQYHRKMTKWQCNFLYGRKACRGLVTAFLLLLFVQKECYMKPDTITCHHLQVCIFNYYIKEVKRTYFYLEDWGYKCNIMVQFLVQTVDDHNFTVVKDIPKLEKVSYKVSNIWRVILVSSLPC